jgi:predicted O-methyltransferase YrrM
MSDFECLTLRRLASLVPDSGTIVEVGSMFGRSSSVWAESKPTATIICIDTFIENYCVKHDIPDEVCAKEKFPSGSIAYNLYQEFQKNTQQYKNIKIIRGYSPTQIQYTGEEIDLFFLDAGHSNPNDWDNIEFFLPYIKQSGIISGHDYNQQYPDVIDNVKRLEKMLNRSSVVIPNTSIWMIKK